MQEQCTINIYDIFKCFVNKFVNYVKCVLYSIMYTIFLSHEIRLIIYLQYVITLYIILSIYFQYWLTINVIEGCQILHMWIYFGICLKKSKRTCLLLFNTEVNVLTLSVSE